VRLEAARYPALFEIERPVTIDRLNSISHRSAPGLALKQGHWQAQADVWGEQPEARQMATPPASVPQCLCSYQV